MSLFHKIMNKLGRYRLIKDRISGDDYMHRYYLFLKDRKWFPFNITLHKIMKSDEPVNTLLVKSGCSGERCFGVDSNQPAPI